MTRNLLIWQSKIWLLIILCCAVLLFSFDCPAQINLKKTKKNVLPRVGAIKDYPATGLMVGCANYYFSLPNNIKSEDESYVFLARAEGNDAWMNLNGRDVNLTQIKSGTRESRKSIRYGYSFGKTRIQVRIKSRGDVPDDYTLQALITLRRNRSVRNIRAIGYSDC
jgi:hypothetical protein